MNDRIISKVIAEMEIVPRDKQFSGQLWNMSEFIRFKQIRSQLFLVNGVLVRDFKVQPFSNLHSVVVIPEKMKAEFLEPAHDNGGHQGVEMTLDRLKMIAYWVGMQLAVTEYVNSCDGYQEEKLPLTTRAALLNTPLGRLLQMLQVDV